MLVKKDHRAASKPYKSVKKIIAEPDSGADCGGYPSHEKVNNERVAYFAKVGIMSLLYFSRVSSSSPHIR